jgi:hypothetical protein
VVWRAIVSIAQAGNVVGGITGGGQPWLVREGEVLVELDNGFVVFEVRGLVFAGGNTIGTPGAVNQVKGTLVCGPSSASPTVVDTPLVALDAQGNAEFSGSFSSSTAVAVLWTWPSSFALRAVRGLVTAPSECRKPALTTADAAVPSRGGRKGQSPADPV